MTDNSISLIKGVQGSSHQKPLFHLTRAFDVIGALKSQSITVSSKMFEEIHKSYVDDSNEDIKIHSHWRGCQFTINIDGYSILITKAAL